MDVMDIEKEVKIVIAEELSADPEKIKPEDSLIKDLGADSLDAVEIVMQLEEKFGIDMPDEDAKKMTTVGEIIEYVKEKKGFS